MMKFLLFLSVLSVFSFSYAVADAYYNVQSKSSPCLLDKDPGPCEAAITRYFFSKRTGLCEQFIYGGCLGNANNFVSKLSCKRTCQNLQCKLPPETGPCRARIPSYFFNSTSHKCEKFIYGGCQGNSNRYVTANDCATSCCPYKGMVHLECACLHTCSSPSTECREKCTPGCDCPQGTVLDEQRNKCVPSYQCPSTITAAQDMAQAPSCPVQGQKFQQCRTCPATCLNPIPRCTLLCVPGCGCPPGQLIDTVINRCVKPDQCSRPPICQFVSCAPPNCTAGVDYKIPLGQCCPVCVCKVGNRTLYRGESYQPDCNTCICTDTGLVICTLIECPVDPCDNFECPSGSKCEVYQPTGEPFCQPSCDLDNGGCRLNETCSLQLVQCVRAPCPLVVKCLPNQCRIEGQVFTTCGTACPPTCSQPGPVVCTRQCVIGCQCPLGTVLNEAEKKCVTLDQCDQCPIEGQVFTTCGTACPPTCSRPVPFPPLPGSVECTLQCVVGCQCPLGTVLDEAKKKCVTLDQCDLCPIEGQMFTTCGTACPPTCSEPGPVVCTLQCVVGCQCPLGTVLDEVEQKCVTLDQCAHENQTVQTIIEANENQTIQRITEAHENQTVQRITEAHENQTVQKITEAHENQTVQRITEAHENQTIQRITEAHENQTVQTITEAHENQTVQTITEAPENQTITEACPPTCSHQFCSNDRNKHRPCSRPPPYTVPPCPDKCHTTFCSACYYSDTVQQTPQYCDHLCGFPPSTRCLRYWSQCTYLHGYHTTVERSSENFRCYDYKCPP